MKVPARYNKNSRMDLVKGGLEGAAVGISFFSHRIAGAGVKILFAFHLEEKETVMLTDYDCEYSNTPLQIFDPFKLMMIKKVMSLKIEPNKSQIHQVH